MLASDQCGECAVLMMVASRKIGCVELYTWPAGARSKHPEGPRGKTVIIVLVFLVRNEGSVIVRDCFAVAPIRANRNHENLNANYQNTRRMLIYSIYNINIKISIMLGYIRKKSIWMLV